MLKLIFAALLMGFCSGTMAQAPLQPGKIMVNRQLVRNTNYVMNWYMLRDTSRIMFGKVSTSIQKQGKTLLVETRVNIKGTNGIWVDTSIADPATLRPLYHSSYNMQREMKLRYDKQTASGYHIDKMKNNKRTEWLDTLDAACFDSNLYPVLIGWLPLKEGYTTALRIYNFDPSGTSGEMLAFIKEVRTARTKTMAGTETDTWAVTVSDEIGNGENGTSIYYFNKTNRQLLRQEITVGKRKMLMELVEE